MAASRSPVGSAARKFRISRVQIGIPNATWTSTSGMSVSYSPIALNSWNSGMRTAWGGKNIPAMTIANSAPRPRNSAWLNT